MNELVAKDFLGREILPGDHVVYPRRRGSYMRMVHAVVETVSFTAGRCDGINVKRVGGGKVSRVSRIDRVVVVKST